MQAALQDAQIGPERLTTSTCTAPHTANDAAEALAVSVVFGRAVACSSTKGATGHALGAAGAIEAVIAAIALRRTGARSAGTRTVDTQLLPATGCSGSAALRHVLSNSFGFGGSNCALVLDCRDDGEHRRAGRMVEGIAHRTGFK